MLFLALALYPVAALLGVLVFASAAAGELVQVIGIRGIAQGRDPHLVARTSVLEWSIGAIGWVVVIRTGDLAYLVPEVLGLYIGSWYGAARNAPRPSDV